MAHETKRTGEFLTKLADLCEEYDAAFSYTNNDDGIHVRINGEDVLVSDSLDAKDLAKDLRDCVARLSLAVAR
jgi:hypothetical protein